LRLPKNDVIELVKSLNLNPGIRAEQLRVEDWQKLFKVLLKFK
jgi:16S rRNA A1518/A1519 N6-dimethyltransferase RsmA/KsgA/DIM1 with predicted DNA glycosylase/AP lyase activity